MEDIKGATVSMVLSLEETEKLAKAKEKSGIKNNADLFRHLLTIYTKEGFIPPNMRDAE